MSSFLTVRAYIYYKLFFSKIFIFLRSFQSLNLSPSLWVFECILSYLKHVKFWFYVEVFIFFANFLRRPNLTVLSFLRNFPNFLTSMVIFTSSFESSFRIDFFNIPSRKCFYASVLVLHTSLNV